MLPSPQGGECSMLRAKCHNLEEKFLKRMVTELKLRVAKYYDYAFSGEGTYSNVVHSECADVSQGAVYHVHVLCLLVWVQSEHSWENPFYRPPNLIKLSPALRHELSTIFHKVYVFYESLLSPSFVPWKMVARAHFWGIFQGFLSQLSLFDIVSKEKGTIVFDLKGRKGGGK
jgi:hypothetical protein